MEKTEKKSKKNIFIIVGILLFLGIGCIIGFIFLSMNKKLNVTFDYNNETKNDTIEIKRNSIIDDKYIKDNEDLGELFINWYEVTTDKNGNMFVAEEAFDFKTKITKDTYLKAMYEEKKTITISFDSKGGSTVDSITIEKGAELKLPTNPTREGYNFGHWEDRHATPIYDGALLADDIHLYAVWVKKDEVLKLSLTNTVIHPNGKLKTTEAKVTVENTEDKPTFTLNDNICAKVDEQTGKVTLNNLSGNNKATCFENGKKITLTATLPSGLSKTATFEIEKLLTLKNNDLPLQHENTMSIGDDFNVTSSLNVTWDIKVASGYKYTGTTSKTSTKLSGTLDCLMNNIDSHCSTITITATTKAGQVFKTSLFGG